MMIVPPPALPLPSAEGTEPGSLRSLGLHFTTLRSSLLTPFAAPAGRSDKGSDEPRETRDKETTIVKG